MKKNIAEQNTSDSENETNSQTGEQNQDTFDPSKLGDEEFAKFFEDPRVFRHPRFKTLSDKAKKATEYERAEEDRQAENLKRRGEFEALAKNAEEKARRAEERLRDAQIENQLQMLSVKFGAVDVETVVSLIDKSKISIDEVGNVSGAEEAVQKILEAKPFLKKGNTVNLGEGTNPAQSTAKKYKLSQLNDPRFYRENERDILAAMYSGNVEDDVSK